MSTANLRKVGGSVMLAIPPAILDLLHLQPGTTVSLDTDGNRLVITPVAKPRYTLAELLARCDTSLEPSDEDRTWLDNKPVGGELL